MRAQIRRSLACGLLILLGAAGAAHAETLYVDGAALVVTAPPGYCNDQEPALLAFLQQTAVQRRPITIAAPCDELQAFKAGSLPRLQRYIVWSVETTESGAALTMPGVSRTEFADGMASSLPVLDLSEVMKEANEGLGAIGLAAEIRSPGLIDRDPDAIYIASVLNYSGGGETSNPIAVVVAFATIDGFSLTINAYDDLRNGGTFSELLGLVKPVMRSTLTDNPE
jgi:hypothetical protein